MSSSPLDNQRNASSAISTQWTFLTSGQQANAACFIEQEQRDHPPAELILLAYGGKLRARVPPFVITFGI